MQGLELLSWFHLRQRPFGSSEGTYFFLKWVHCRYRPSLNRNFCPLSQLGNDSRAAVGGNRKPRMSNPSKTEDVKTTLNRIRRNYAQNPLYVWLFSASCMSSPSRSIPTKSRSLDHCLMLSTGINPKILPSLPRYPCIMVNSSLRRSRRLRRVSPTACDCLTIDMEPCWATR